MWLATEKGNRNIIVDRSTSDTMRSATGNRTFAVVPSWLVPLGVIVQLGQQNWRLVAKSPVPQPVPVSGHEWTSLSPGDSTKCDAALKSAAAEQHRKLSLSDAETMTESVTTYETEEHCFFAFRERKAAEGVYVEPGRSLATMAIYEKPDSSGEKLPQATGWSPQALAWVAFGEHADSDNEWLINNQHSSPNQGWVALHVHDPANEFIGMPWSTEAIMKLAREVSPTQSSRAPPRL